MSLYFFENPHFISADNSPICRLSTYFSYLISDCLRGHSSTRSDQTTEESKSGVIFINNLWAAFTLEDPKCVKRQSSHQCLFALLGPKHIKAARIMLVKLTTGQHLHDLLGLAGSVHHQHVPRRHRQVHVRKRSICLPTFGTCCSLLEFQCPPFHLHHSWQRQF